MVQVIVSLDIMDGKCVQLGKGSFPFKTVYAVDPVEVAKELEAAGVRRLHIVDLDGAMTGMVINLSVLQRVAESTSMTIDFGGGVKNEEELERVFNAGADMIAVGTQAVKNPDKVKGWFSKYSGDKLILGVDVKNGFVAIKGWEEVSQTTPQDLIKTFLPVGLKTVLCTDTTRDGKMDGPSIDFYKTLQAQFPGLNIIASGGISSADHIKTLDSAGLHGAIIGRAYYEGKISLVDIKSYL